jgi:hypothetical protein
MFAGTSFPRTAEVVDLRQKKNRSREGERPSNAGVCHAIGVLLPMA